MLTLKTMFAELFGEEKNGNHFILQAENGGRISIGPDEIGVGHSHDFIRSLSVLRSRLRKVQHDNIRGFEPKETILTIHCHDRVLEIEESVDKNTHSIVWSGEAYDIGDLNISKGTGLTKIKKVLGERAGKEISAIAIGDRLNDLDLLEKADISVSADRKILKEADYFAPDNTDKLPGVIMAQHLLKRFREKDLG